jgi:hypothetical protein
VRRCLESWGRGSTVAVTRACQILVAWAKERGICGKGWCLRSIHWVLLAVVSLAQCKYSTPADHWPFNSDFWHVLQLIASTISVLPLHSHMIDVDISCVKDDDISLPTLKYRSCRDDAPIVIYIRRYRTWPDKFHSSPDDVSKHCASLTNACCQAFESL